METNTILCGDCIELMKDLPKDSIDAVVTDPPYGLAFMSKEWDQFKPKEYQEFSDEWGKQCLRVMKAGAYLLAFSGTRTYHRMVVGLEDAGFEIRDQIDWIYGSGFPKSHDISKAIDKKFLREELTKRLGHKPTLDQLKQALKQEREVVDSYEESSGWKAQDRKNAEQGYRPNRYYDDEPDEIRRTVGATQEAKEWDGWGTALKPAHESIVLAQKPREGTYAENVLKYGVGGLNIGDSRVGVEKLGSIERGNSRFTNFMSGGSTRERVGRWPANVILDSSAAAMLDGQSGESKSNVRQPQNKKYEGMGKYDPEKSNFSFQDDTVRGHNDSGGASRFFYCAKAHKSERDAGLEALEDGEYLDGIKDREWQKKRGRNPEKYEPPKNDIASLKPINLMRYLVRLVTPPEGIVLDPFAGSGTTGCACVIEGFNYILIEKRDRFANLIAPKRIEYWSKEENWSQLKEHSELESPKVLRTSKLDMFT